MKPAPPTWPRLALVGWIRGYPGLPTLEVRYVPGYLGMSCSVTYCMSLLPQYLVLM
jgi:hypothetical protein